MQSSFHDGNNQSTFVLVGTDGSSIMNGKVDPVTHALIVSDGTTGSDNGPVVSLHDNNHVHIMMGTSSADGKTPVPVYGINGAMLIDSI